MCESRSAYAGMSGLITARARNRRARRRGADSRGGALPPLPHGPDLLRLAIDLAGVGGIELPLESSAIDSYASATDPAERRITIVARQPNLARTTLRNAIVKISAICPVSFVTRFLARHLRSAHFVFGPRLCATPVRRWAIG